MSRARSIGAPLLTALLVTACAEPPTTAVEFDGYSTSADLHFSVPALGAEQLVATQPVSADTDRVPEVAGPARAGEFVEGEFVDGEEPSGPEDVADYLDEVGSVYDRRTYVGFGPTYGYSWGEHRYQGNKGRVTTTATISLDGQQLGSQTAVSEDYGLFLIDGPQVKYIATIARAYTDQGCGLQVSGASQHEAWWEWFMGFGVATWGVVRVDSDTSPESQDPCEPVEAAVAGGPSGLATVCWFSIDYDLETGEIVSVELLFCTGMSEQIGG